MTTNMTIVVRLQLFSLLVKRLIFDIARISIANKLSVFKDFKPAHP